MPEWIHTLTVDASRTLYAGGLTGVGIVVQARIGARGRGPILEEISEVHQDPSGACEALAILRGLDVARLRGFQRIKVRSDCNPLRTKLRKALRGQSRKSLSGVASQILGLAAQFAWVDFGYVPRRKNQIAHRLANAARLRALSELGLEACSHRPPEVGPWDHDDSLWDDEVL